MLPGQHSASPASSQIGASLYLQGATLGVGTETAEPAYSMVRIVLSFSFTVALGGNSGGGGEL